ncbi:MAG: pyridoxamine 5'-phosphate oxidase family protein [Thaumarchaeota archaeon]|nr:MAG: pyridoxamine 5'-phosphate oxidase family protein [Nitrososphaerota archaeon]TLY07395.1 MAG: pyridoxamine 5'-phosphate oxidase family protein [Nitrososphaerota archaeon]
MMKIVNAMPGLGKSLSEQQVRDFLARSKLNLQLGTIDEKGEPNIHPIWYIFENDRIYVATSKKSKKAKNSLRQKLVYFSIDDESFPYKGVKGKGTVKSLEDINYNVKIAEKIITKYMGNLENDLAKWIINEIMQGNEAVLEINPKFYSAWSFA